MGGTFGAVRSRGRLLFQAGLQLLEFLGRIASAAIPAANLQPASGGAQRDGAGFTINAAHLSNQFLRQINFGFLCL
jgi:hypothetical protein